MDPRFDKINNKANEVNNRLVLMCGNSDIHFFSHSESINPSKDLSESELNRNFNGVKFLQKIFQCFSKGSIDINNEKSACPHL